MEPDSATLEFVMASESATLVFILAQESATLVFEVAPDSAALAFVEALFLLAGLILFAIEYHALREGEAGAVFAVALVLGMAPLPAA